MDFKKGKKNMEIVSIILFVTSAFVYFNTKRNYKLNSTDDILMNDDIIIDYVLKKMISLLVMVGSLIALVIMI